MEDHGQTPVRQWLLDTSVELEERWCHFRPYLPLIQDTGYARAPLAALNALYGVNEVKDSNYREISDRLQADNKPGLYQRILNDRCNIEKVINQGEWGGGTGDGCVSVEWSPSVMHGVAAEEMGKRIRQHADGLKGQAPTLESWTHELCSDVQARGSVGLKITANIPVDPIDDDKARRLFDGFLTGKGDTFDAEALGLWAVHRAINLAPRYGLVVAVHCGLCWCGGMDIRELDPANIIPLILGNPDTIFDLYHAGIPWTRKIAVIGNQHANVILNLCWTHQISPYMTEQLVNELIDLVSSNRIIAFGGDNEYPEKTLGALILARENIARALAVRVERKQMNMSRAVETCRAWFYDNPKLTYAL